MIKSLFIFALLTICNFASAECAYDGEGIPNEDCSAVITYTWDAAVLREDGTAITEPVLYRLRQTINGVTQIIDATELTYVSESIPPSSNVSTTIAVIEQGREGQQSDPIQFMIPEFKEDTSFPAKIKIELTINCPTCVIQ